MIRKNDGVTITAVERTVQGKGTVDTQNFQTQLIPCTSPVDDHATNGAVETMKVCFTVRCSSLLHFFQSTRISRCANISVVSGLFVFFLMCSLKANPSCVPLGEMLDIDDLDPARLLQRKSMNDYVDLVSRRHEADDVWVRHKEAQDRTMSAMGKILLGIETEYKENELDKPKRTGHARACQQSCRNGNKNSNSNDVVNEVFLRRVNVSAVPLLKTSYLQLESYFKRSDVQFCVKECDRGVRDRMQRATGICRLSLVFFFVKCDC